MNLIILFGIACLFLLGAPLLNLCNYTFGSDIGATYMKVHPATYVFVIAAAGLLASARRSNFRVFTTPMYGVFIVMSVILTLDAVIFPSTGGGTMTVAVTTFLTLGLVIATLPALDLSMTEKVRPALRIFLLVNSAMGITEQIIKHRIIPSYIDIGREWRSSGLMGMPLNGALITGLYIVYLATAGNNRSPVIVRVCEIFFHILAMFAFGGRSSILNAVIVIAFGAVTARTRKGERRISLLQRLAPIVLLMLAVSFVLLPIPFVEAALERFTNDGGSADQRTAAIQMFLSLDWHSMLFGIAPDVRDRLLVAYHSVSGIELGWVALAMSFGLLFVIPLAISLTVMLFGMARRLDRAASYMVLYFMLVSAGSLSIGAPSLLICQAVVMLVILCQPKAVRERLRRPRTEVLRVDGVSLAPVRMAA